VSNQQTPPIRAVQPSEFAEYAVDPNGGWGYAQGPAPESEPDVNILDLIRRNLALIAICTVAAGLVGALITAWLPRVYEASASIRIDEKSSQLPALDALGISTGNAVATELEMLGSRSLAEQVVDSLGLRVQVSSPRAIATRDIFTNVAVADSADAIHYVLTPDASGQLHLVDSTGAAVAPPARPGWRMNFRGVTLQLTPTAADYGPVEFNVLAAEEAVEAFQSAVDVTRRNRDADIVDVSFTSTDPDLARDVANTLATRFIRGRQEFRQLDARSTVNFLRDQVSRASDQLDVTERSLRAFREREHVISIKDEASTGVSQYAELRAQRNALDVERSALQQLLQRPRSNGTPAGDSSAPSDLLAYPTLLKSAAASSLMAALTAAEDRRNELLARRTPQDPDVKVLDDRIAKLHQDMRGLVTTYLQGLTNQVSALDATLARSDAQLRSIPVREIRLAELERNADNTAAIYSMLQTRLKEAEIAAASTDPSVRLVDAAVAPLTPVEPRPLINIAVALVAGTLLGLSGAFLRERADRSFHTRRELLALTGVPVLGLIPRLRAKRLWSLPGTSPARRLSALPSGRGNLDGDVTQRQRVQETVDRADRRYDTDELFVFQEAHARLATNLAFLRTEPAIRALAITSALAGDGKTTVASNVALALSREGKRVILIDADLRSGLIASVLGIGDGMGQGLSDVLTGRVEPAQAVVRVAVGRDRDLHVITRGDGSGPPARLLGSTRARELLEWARANYDMVIVDTPPVNSVADAALVSPLIDGVILVGRAGTTPRDALEFAVEQLRIVHAPVIGAVLNDLDFRRDAAYRGGYGGAYKRYGHYGASPQSAAN
jgi:tyrosine-protein kinase Etk/Wzc